MKDLQYYLTVIPAVLLAISFHELSHAYVAYLLGDPTAKNMGRLTFNPISHIDPIGLFCMIFFGFGWAKPVPVNTTYFKNRKLGMGLTALGGPMANFFLGIVAIIIYLFIAWSTNNAFLLAFASFMSVFASVNISLGVFNLLPVPPLDGSKIMFIFLPNKLVGFFYQYEGYIRLVLMLCIFRGVFDVPLGAAQSFVINAAYDVTVKLGSLVGIL